MNRYSPGGELLNDEKFFIKWRSFFFLFKKMAMLPRVIPIGINIINKPIQLIFFFVYDMKNHLLIFPLAQSTLDFILLQNQLKLI